MANYCTPMPTCSIIKTKVYHYLITYLDLLYRYIITMQILELGTSQYFKKIDYSDCSAD